MRDRCGHSAYVSPQFAARQLRARVPIFCSVQDSWAPQHFDNRQYLRTRFGRTHGVVERQRATILGATRAPGAERFAEERQVA